LYLATRSLLYCRVIVVDLLENVIPFICDLMANQLGFIGIWMYDINVCLNIWLFTERIVHTALELIYLKKHINNKNLLMVYTFQRVLSVQSVHWHWYDLIDIFVFEIYHSLNYLLKLKPISLRYPRRWISCLSPLVYLLPKTYYLSFQSVDYAYVRMV
jgi:hypothetical protein